MFIKKKYRESIYRVGKIIVDLYLRMLTPFHSVIDKGEQEKSVAISFYYYYYYYYYWIIGTEKTKSYKTNLNTLIIKITT